MDNKLMYIPNCDKQNNISSSKLKLFWESRFNKRPQSFKKQWMRETLGTSFIFSSIFTSHNCDEQNYPVDLIITSYKFEQYYIEQFNRNSTFP